MALLFLWMYYTCIKNINEKVKVKVKVNKFAIFYSTTCGLNGVGGVRGDMINRDDGSRRIKMASIITHTITIYLCQHNLFPRHHLASHWSAPLAPGLWLARLETSWSHTNILLTSTNAEYIEIFVYVTGLLLSDISKTIKCVSVFLV